MFRVSKLKSLGNSHSTSKFKKHVLSRNCDKLSSGEWVDRRAKGFASELHYPLALTLTLTRPFREERKGNNALIFKFQESNVSMSVISISIKSNQELNNEDYEILRPSDTLCVYLSDLISFTTFFQIWRDSGSCFLCLSANMLLYCQFDYTADAA
jgi:hypothetical protein